MKTENLNREEAANRIKDEIARAEAEAEAKLGKMEEEGERHYKEGHEAGVDCARIKLTAAGIAECLQEPKVGLYRQGWRTRLLEYYLPSKASKKRNYIDGFFKGLISEARALNKMISD